jgi:hypothetical protein
MRVLETGDFPPFSENGARRGITFGLGFLLISDA